MLDVIPLDYSNKEIPQLVLFFDALFLFWDVFLYLMKSRNRFRRGGITIIGRRGTFKGTSFASLSPEFG